MRDIIKVGLVKVASAWWLLMVWHICDHQAVITMTSWWARWCLRSPAHYCLLNRLFRCRSKKPSNFRGTGLCEGNSSVTGEFPAQRASNMFPFDDVIMRFLWPFWIMSSEQQNVYKNRYGQRNENENLKTKNLIPASTKTCLTIFVTPIKNEKVTSVFIPFLVRSKQSHCSDLRFNCKFVEEISMSYWGVFIV